MNKLSEYLTRVQKGYRQTYISVAKHKRYADGACNISRFVTSHWWDKRDRGIVNSRYRDTKNYRGPEIREGIPETKIFVFD